jgi:predicted negative regulator of RcsB-dependent stress response
MNDSKDSELRHVARLRLARVQIDQGKPDDAISTLAAAEPGRFAVRYHEVRGDALYAKNDAAGAVREYQARNRGQRCAQYRYGCAGAEDRRPGRGRRTPPARKAAP